MDSTHKLYITDHILAKTLLRLIPRSVKPNQVTVFRFLATPFVIGLLYYQYYFIGLLAFVVVASTDAIDGALARTRDQITDWGKFYDPVADKLLIGSMVFAVLAYHVVWYILMGTLGLEIIIMSMAGIGKKKGAPVQANWWGKGKMILQCLGVGSVLLEIGIGVPGGIYGAHILLGTALILGVVSIFRYRQSYAI